MRDGNKQVASLIGPVIPAPHIHPSVAQQKSPVFVAGPFHTHAVWGLSSG